MPWVLVLLVIGLGVGLRAQAGTKGTTDPAVTLVHVGAVGSDALYWDATQPIDLRVKDLVDMM